MERVTETAVREPKTSGTPQANTMSPQEHRQRVRIGLLLVLLTVSGGWLFLVTDPGTVTFQLSGRLEENQVPDIVVSARPLALVGVLVMAAIAALQSVAVARHRRVGALSGGWGVLVFTAFGIAFVLTFLAWAASGRTFPLTNQFQGTLTLATPLIFGALAGVLGERAGVINIAIEGQFLVGAFTAAVVGTVTGSALIGTLGAAAGGVLIAVLLAVFAIRYLVNQIVVGVVLVVFATGITGFLYDQFVQEAADRFNTPPVMAPVRIPLLADIPLIGRVLFQQTVLVYTMYVAVALVTFVLFHTRWGLRVRAVGEHPRAADTVGVDVQRVRYQAVLAGGVAAGLGGAFFTVGFGGGFFKEMTAGNGFIALAALIMGRWHPVGATLAALFFGFTLQLQSQLQVMETSIPGGLLLMTPYLITVVAVAGLVGRMRPPAANGEPYVKE